MFICGKCDKHGHWRLINTLAENPIQYACPDHLGEMVDAMPMRLATVQGVGV